MPTPVSTAKQCLNSEASHALEEAVSVARRRGHAQTTSLHAVSAFLSLSPSQLREACVRARNAAFYPRVQLKALDFWLSVSLDRLPTSQPRADEPPVSNSLMAAIKRSQANQRRQPESIIAIRNQNQLLGQCQEQLGTSSGVKVELQHLIVSILDDPIVSRVFNDAGFRSFDVKLAILRPFQSFFRYPQRGIGHQGLFFCNLDGNSDPGNSPFRFPFSGYWDGHENYRRIGDVLVRKKGRNPLLVGVCANDALRGFMEALETRMDVLPLEVRGIKVVSLEKDVLKFVNEQWSDEAMSLRFKEVGMMVQHCLGPGLMVSIGNLRCFLGGEKGFGMDVLNSVIRKLSKLLEAHSGKVWLIGFAANDQAFMEFLSRYPSIDKDWDLHLLPITSVKPMMGGESVFKSSLMGSFVPFGGFFSSPYDLKGPLSSSYHVNSSNQCNENSERQRSAFPRRGVMASVADQHRPLLSPWLQMVEPTANNAFSDLKAKGGKMLLVDTVESLQRKWDRGCRHLQHRQSSPEPETCQERFLFTTGASSNYFQGKTKNVHDEKNLTSHPSNPVLLGSAKNDDFLSKISETPSGTDHSLGGSWLCISGADDSQTSPSEVYAVKELGLELFPDPCKQQRKENADLDRSHAVKCSTDACFDLAGKPGSSNSKTLFEALSRRVGRQYEAVRNICRIIADSCTDNGRIQNSSLRGDIWLNCIGPDLFGKRKVALALANILYGSENNFIHIDFDSEHSLFLQKMVFGHQLPDQSDVKFRGKTTVDHIAEELRKTPFGVVFLENVHSADPVAQRSLSQAIKTGRFSDSHGREVPINNRIFVLTSEDNFTRSREKQSNFLEERIASAKGWPIQITVRTGEDTHNQTFVNKRKLNGSNETNEQSVNLDLVKKPHRGLGRSLDLNLPAEVNDNDVRSDTWLEEFSREVEKTSVKVVFDPFDYDALATKVLKWVHRSFCKAVGSECSLEIDPKVMDQVLAAACLSEADNGVEAWIDRVLGKGFAEAQKRYQLTAHSVVTVACFVPLCPEEHKACLLPLKIVLP